MLTEVFYWLINMSIAASVAGMAVCLIGTIGRIPRKIICALWIVPFFRMWVPIGKNSSLSLMSCLSEFTAKTVQINDGSADFSMMNFVMGADTYFPITYKTHLLESVLEIAAVVWVVIAAVLLITAVILYAAAKAELRNTQLLRDNIYVSDQITSPAAYGIFSPKIILPKAYDTGELKWILMHENAHIKRRDNLWRAVAAATVCIHWFNPLCWLFLPKFFESLELACDEAVLRQCGDEEKKSYAKALLHHAESRSLYASAFGGAKMRVRIERILSYKKLSALSSFAFSALAAAVGYVLLTNAG